MYDNLICEKKGPIAILQLHRPEKKNALNAALRKELRHALAEIARDTTSKVVVLTGGTETFCAGADITEIQEATSPEENYKHAREFQLLFDRVEGLPQPVIAAVSGYALGGGCELALACDLRIASETAQLGLPEIKIGAFPGGGGTQRLPRLIGAAKAKEMIFTGDPVNAAQALSLGLVTRVAAKDKLLDEVMGMAEKLAALPRLAMEAAKMLINRGQQMDLSSGLELEARTFGTLATTHDLSEGTRAFLEKRKPAFTD